MSSSTIHSQAPTRVDLAGGTLDIWPLYLFHENSQTINFAINRYARCRLTPRRGKTIEFVSCDLGWRESFSSLEVMAGTKKFRLPLLARLAMAFAPRDGFTLETDSESPAGAGLGGSSALNIAVCGALSEFAGVRLRKEKLIKLAGNVEAQVLGVPTGDQDYYSAVNGGIQAICMGPFGVLPERIPMDQHELGKRVILCYTGKPHNSGINNWEVMKAHMDGQRSVIRLFDDIAAIANEMRIALEGGAWDEVARLMRREWTARKKNHPGITTPTIEKLIAIAGRNGGLAAKACGAGGGGCVAFLVEPDSRQRVASALREQGARLLSCQVAEAGLEVRRNLAGTTRKRRKPA